MPKDYWNYNLVSIDVHADGVPPPSKILHSPHTCCEFYTPQALLKNTIGEIFLRMKLNFKGKHQKCFCPQLKNCLRFLLFCSHYDPKKMVTFSNESTKTITNQIIFLALQPKKPSYFLQRRICLYLKKHQGQLEKYLAIHQKNFEKHQARFYQIFAVIFLYISHVSSRINSDQTKNLRSKKNSRS